MNHERMYLRVPDPKELEYRCTSCGELVDEDHDYCAPCDQRGGEWVEVEEDEEE